MSCHKLRKRVSNLVLTLSVALIAIATATPSQAQLRPEDIINFGIQALQQSNQQQQRQQQQRQQQQRQQQQRQPAARQAAPKRQAPIPQSPAVAQAQRYLNQLGYNAGRVDGQAGPQTRQAISNYQRDNGLQVTGQADMNLISTLRASLLQATSQGNMSAAQAMAPQPALPAGMVPIEGIDLPGGDYISGLDNPALVGIGVQGCAQVCTSLPDCRAFTYNTGVDICFLKNAVGEQRPFDRAISGIKGGIGAAGGQVGVAFPAEAAPQPATAEPGPADFVRLALMSDREAYLAQAGMAGISYILATGTEQQCRMLSEAEHQDEFARREVIDMAAEQFRQVMASLPAQAAPITIPISADYSLQEYDFQRQGFPIAEHSQSQTQVLKGGIVKLIGNDRPSSCRLNWSSYSDFGAMTIEPPDFNALGAEHAGMPSVNFLPMAQAEARAYRASGNQVTLRAMLTVEPRDQGRGPLKGTLSGLSAHDPESGRLLYRWEDSALAPAATGDSGVAWSGDTLAAIIAPVLEPHIDQQSFDIAAIQYFQYQRETIAAGNSPPQSPLPLAAMRGQAPELIVSRNRELLRQAMRDTPVSLPLVVTIDQRINPGFDEENGLRFGAYGTGLANMEEQDPLAELQLSDRGLQLYNQLTSRHDWDNDVLTQGFRLAIINNQSRDIQLEFDRLVHLPNAPMDIETALAHGLAGDGYQRGQQRDNVILRWTLELTEARYVQDQVIISASLRNLSYLWESDGSAIASFPAESFTTLAALRAGNEAALPPLASTDSIAVPPAGSRWGAEMTDLLQLRYLPDSIDDRVIERMMITRFAYEATTKEGAPEWGRFFRNTGTDPTQEELRSRLDEFRSWSAARAVDVPDQLSLLLPMEQGMGGNFAPYENKQRLIDAIKCEVRTNRNANNGPTESEAALARVCEYLAAAIQPEPLLFLNEGVATGYSRDLRYDCEDDAYCSQMYEARIATDLPHQRRGELIRLDQLPVIDASIRSSKDDFAIQIDVQPTGATLATSYPDSIWRAALTTAKQFADAHGVQLFIGEMPKPDPALVVFEAKTVAARLINRETGAVVTELALAAPQPPSADLLDLPTSNANQLDLLGLRLGMPFPEMDSIIREHMEVKKVLTADRNKQLSATTGALVPFTSGRIYVSANEDELIAVFDEPPAAPEKIVGIWRIQRLPLGTLNPNQLKQLLTERYGEPKVVTEVGLPMMQKGVAFMWTDFADGSCGPISFDFQTDLWKDETGASWLPGFMNRPLFPRLSLMSYIGVDSKPLQPSSLCPGLLGVRFATYDGRNAGQPAGDEIVSWLTDDRSYGQIFVESLKGAAETPVSEVSPNPMIKF